MAAAMAVAMAMAGTTMVLALTKVLRSMESMVAITCGTHQCMAVAAALLVVDAAVNSKHVIKDCLC